LANDSWPACLERSLDLKIARVTSADLTQRSHVTCPTDAIVCWVLIGLLACPIFLDVASFALADQFGSAALGGIAGGIWGGFFGWFAAGFGIGAARANNSRRRALRITSIVFACLQLALSFVSILTYYFKLNALTLSSSILLMSAINIVVIILVVFTSIELCCEIKSHKNCCTGCCDFSILEEMS